MNSQPTLMVSAKLRHLEEIKKRNRQIIDYAETFINLSGSDIQAQTEIAGMCRPKDLDESLEIAEKLKVLQIVVSDEIKIVPTEENTAASVKQSRKMVNMAMERYVSNLGVDMGKYLTSDNRSELNKIFQVYQ